MSTVKTRLVSMGNSRGIRIPESLLIDQIGLVDEVDLRVHNGDPDRAGRRARLAGLRLRPVCPPKSPQACLTSLFRLASTIASGAGEGGPEEGRGASHQPGPDPWFRDSEDASMPDRIPRRAEHSPADGHRCSDDATAGQDYPFRVPCRFENKAGRSDLKVIELKLGGMSAIGTKRTFVFASHMSAFGGKAAYYFFHSANVCF